MEAKKEKCCGGIILKDGRVLMVHQDNGVFAFPKGHVEGVESEEQTALREIKEETGIDVELNLSKRIELFYHIEESNVDKTVVLFFGKPLSDLKPRAQEGEISEALWVKIQDVEEKLQFKEWKEAWKKAQEMMKEEK